EEPRMVMDVNLNSTLRSLEFAEQNNCRYVFTSSPEAYGESEIMPLGGDEASVFPVSHEHQRHAYGASKYLGELAVQHSVRQGLDARIVRPFNGYGPRLLGSEYGQVVAMMLQRAVQQGEIIVHGDGSQTRSLTYIDDLVRGIEAAGLVEGLEGMSLNLGSEEECTMLDLAQRVAELVGNETAQTVRIRYEQGHPGDSKRRLPNLDQTKKYLNWQAHTTLANGLGQTLRSML
ncbi:MAG: NAD-dependent epimerase/dehydratase family protein, partial [Candidatus Thermoplasmatota archaeon]|nr:NAD-dependent epimerase/dehydratase family protein [Candidatus Thermoplasmatota archaeon]